MMRVVCPSFLRRLFMATIGLLLLSSVMPVSVLADAGSDAAAANDLVALNYALTLEHLEATFYAMGQAKWSAQDFISAGYTQQLYDRFTLIAQHEAAHVTALTATIGNHGGQAVPACTYNFNLTSVLSYIQTAKLLENTGVSAYDGAINSISDTDLQQVAATIATVEARHAAYLNNVLGISGFPDATDTALTPDQIAAAIKPLLNSCPYTIKLPTVRPGGVRFSSTLPPVSENTQPACGVYTTEQLNNDLVALNYALTLEHLEATFYNQGLAKYDSAAFAAANYNASVYDRFVMVGAHENAHVSALTTLIQGRGGQAAPACTYNFDLSTIEKFVSTAATLENTGVTAYDGAVNSLADVGLQQIAATVATVEARHASYLNELTGVVPFPAVTDDAKSPTEIVQAVTPFIQSCPYELKTPSVAKTTPCAGSSFIVGDPAFVGLRSQHYQVHGVAGEVYNIVSDSDLQYNSRFVFLDQGDCPVVNGKKQKGCFAHAGSYLGELGLKTRFGDKIFFAAGSATEGFASVQLNGKPVELSAVEQLAGEAGFVSLNNTHLATVRIGNWQFDFENSDMFINQRVQLVSGSSERSLSQIGSHGLLGQTWRKETYPNAVKYVQGQVDDYVIRDQEIFGDDFVFNAFN